MQWYQNLRLAAIKSIMRTLTTLRIVEGISVADNVDIAGMVHDNLQNGARPVGKGILYQRRGRTKSIFVIHYTDMFMENKDGRWN